MPLWLSKLAGFVISSMRLCVCVVCVKRYVRVKGYQRMKRSESCQRRSLRYLLR